MSDVKTYPVPNDWASTAWINKDNYQHMYQQSIERPNEFWASQASEFLTWETPWTSVSSWDFITGEAEWFSGEIGRAHV
jgi:acetyl-CoA synthetase